MASLLRPSRQLFKRFKPGWSGAEKRPSQPHGCQKKVGVEIMMSSQETIPLISAQQKWIQRWFMHRALATCRCWASPKCVWPSWKAFWSVFPEMETCHLKWDSLINDFFERGQLQHQHRTRGLCTGMRSQEDQIADLRCNARWNLLQIEW